MAAALQGYVLGIGQIPPTLSGTIARALMIAGGVLLAVPAPRLSGFSFTANLTIGAALAAFGLLTLAFKLRRMEKGRTSP
jgi:hypothetical protein